MESEEKPLLADGSIIEDYRPLIMYWRKAAKKNSELARKAVLSNDDFKELHRMIHESGSIGLQELLDLFKKKFIQRIDPLIAMEALKEVYGVEFEPSDAQSKIAYIMAGWLIEAGRQLKIISYRSWRDKN